MKEIDYNKVVEVITKIGYYQRSGTYYAIREEDGYINISCDKCFADDTPITFHKNFVNGNRSKDGEHTINKKFYDLESFYEFISEYHNKLFLKLKIKRLTNNII